MTVTFTKSNPLQTATRYPAEIELVLLCARTRINSAIAKKISALASQDLQWQELLNFAQRHGLLPLVYQSLSKICPDSVPTLVLNSLKGSFQQNANRNLLYTAELLKLVALFQQKNIAAIPFKGAALAASAYNNLALRKFCDLDILVKRSQFEEARHILESSGYQLADQFAEIDTKPYVKYDIFNESEKNQKDYTYINFKTKVVIELHWSVDELGFPMGLKTADLWQNNKVISLGGKQIPQFAPETTLIYLCFHSSKHHWEELRWLCDVSELIQANPDLHWDTVRQKAQAWGCDRMVNLGLLLASNLLQVKLPDTVTQEIQQDKEAIALASKIETMIFSDLSLEEYSYLTRSTLLLQYRERLQDKLRTFAHIAFTPTYREWEMIQLPKSLSYFYYIVRPYRLLLEYFSLVDEIEYTTPNLDKEK